MVIKSDMIDRQLRPIGEAIRFVWPSFSERKFKLCNFILKNFGRGADVTPWKIKCEQIKIPRADGSELRLCVYSPRKREGKMPGLLWIHGGGYAMGIPEQDHGFVRSFVGATGCVMVVPDYKKSLYAPFPAALEDCYLALLWLKENGKKYGMRRDKIFVGGNSAGGGMTAALTLYARDRGEVNIAFQMPLYPMLDDRPTETSKNNDAPVWNTKSNIAAWKLYLGGDYGTDRVSKYAAPARETDFSGLPPTLTFIGSIDPFLAETKSYVEALRAAGVPVEFRIFEGGFHSFDIYYFANIAKEANKFIRDGFKYAAEHCSAPQPEDK